ncbi:hypothetical protein D9M71_355040 [compost metagenome]|uniref:hypothetical protein n=1 Tax=unclassified Pseudomonas TaxID=196821 RepID=UPI00128DA022|nr:MULTISPECIES: hypothetical protein [unclassified Pseudomonas]
MSSDRIDTYCPTMTDLKILNILLSSSGALDSFTIFRRSKFGLKLFFERYSKLLYLSFVSEEDGVARLTAAGRALIKYNLPRLGNVKRQWREAPERFIGTRLRDGEFYIPNLELLSIGTFPG